jgi:hypothetical protein
MGRHDGRFGAGGVVLLQFGDGVKQARAQGVVKELRGGVGRCVQQALLQLGTQSGVVGVVDLYKARLCVNGHGVSGDMGTSAGRSHPAGPGPGSIESRISYRYKHQRSTLGQGVILQV